MVADNFEPEERKEPLLEDVAFGDLPADNNVDPCGRVHLDLALSDVSQIVSL